RRDGACGIAGAGALRRATLGARRPARTAGRAGTAAGGAEGLRLPAAAGRLPGGGAVLRRFRTGRRRRGDRVAGPRAGADPPRRRRPRSRPIMSSEHRFILALTLATLGAAAWAQPNAPAANERIEQKGTAPAAGAIVDQTRPP